MLGAPFTTRSVMSRSRSSSPRRSSSWRWRASSSSSWRLRAVKSRTMSRNSSSSTRTTRPSKYRCRPPSSRSYSIGSGRAALERPLAQRHDRLGHVGGQDVPDGAAHELLRREEEDVGVVGLVAAVDPVAADPEHEVRDRVEQRARTGLAALERDLAADALREVADDQHELVLAGGDDPALVGAHLDAEVELVLDRLHVAGRQRAVAGPHDALGDLGREPLPHRAPDDLGVVQVTGALGLEVEVPAVARDAEHEVGDRVEEGARPRLAASQRLEPPLVLDRHAGGSGHGVEQVAIVEQGRVVDHRRDRVPLALDERRLPGPALRGRVDRGAVVVDEQLLLLVPARQRERRVVEDPAQRGLDPVGAAVPADLDHELADRSARQLALEETEERGERDREQADDRHPLERGRKRVGQPASGEDEQHRRDHDGRGDVDRGEGAAYRRRRAVEAAPEDR